MDNEKKADSIQDALRRTHEMSEREIQKAKDLENAAQMEKEENDEIQGEFNKTLQETVDGDEMQPFLEEIANRLIQGPPANSATNSTPPFIQPSGFAMMQQMQQRLGDQYPVEKQPPRSSKEKMEQGIKKDWDEIQKGLDQIDTEKSVETIVEFKNRKLREAGYATPRTPVLNTTPPPATSPSIPASAGIPYQGGAKGMVCQTQAMEALKKFVSKQPFCADWVRQRLSYMENSSPMLPLSTQWKIPKGIDLAAVIYGQIQEEGYIEDMWPTLEMVMSNSVDNCEFAAQVLCFFALADVLVELAAMKAALKR